MKVNEIRELYLNFFEKKDHLRAPSASLVPDGSDKSLLLINSGMAPLKPFFVGVQKPPKERLVNCQKCIRTADIENVGQTARHGTFFEMLGNFSFNDYFKKEAIAYALEFCLDVLKLQKEKIFVSVYKDDDEAYDIWHKQEGIPTDRIVRLGKEDNFWEVGTGPCGPCSELYYDMGEQVGCGSDNCAPGCDCDRFLEFWNLVFTQFNKQDDGTYTELGRVNIDTGMGLERMAVIMQGAASIFDIDTINAIKNKVCEMVGKKYGENHATDVSLRIIIDHIRSITFMIGDGVLPSSEGRGYVLRRLLRRAVRHGRQLGVQKEFLQEIADTTIDGTKQAYPELAQKREHIKTTISREENNFRKTLEQGMELIEDIVKTAKAQNKTIISGEDVFKMYDTFGFPKELMAEILHENGMEIDEQGYKEQMEKQKQRARSARGETGFLGNDDTTHNNLAGYETVFVGYEELTTTAKILTMSQNGDIVETTTPNQGIVFVVLDKTCIFAQSGGQKSDIGTIETENAVAEVTQCHKVPNGTTVHIAEIKKGILKTGDTVKVFANTNHRYNIIRNHTATHLLHSMLRSICGEHITQSGAEKTELKLRFDFNHPSPVSNEEIACIENNINRIILEDINVETAEMPKDKAIEMGATALFGEKYQDTVRVVKIGGYSMELCGGIHVTNTARIGMFKIISESGIAQGVRRIEAVTGTNTFAYMDTKENAVKKIADILKTPQDNIFAKAESLLQENKELKSQLASVTDKLNAASIEKTLDKAEEINGKNVFIARMDQKTQNDLRSMSDQLKDKLKSCAVILVGAHNNSVQIVVTATDDIVKQGFDAGNIAKQLAIATGGNGGGRKNMAQAQGKDISKIEQALTLAREIV